MINVEQRKASHCLVGYSHMTKSTIKLGRLDSRNGGCVESTWYRRPLSISHTFHYAIKENSIRWQYIEYISNTFVIMHVRTSRSWQTREVWSIPVSKKRQVRSILASNRTTIKCQVRSYRDQSLLEVQIVNIDFVNKPWTN